MCDVFKGIICGIYGVGVEVEVDVMRVHEFTCLVYEASLLCFDYSLLVQDDLLTVLFCLPWLLLLPWIEDRG